MAFKQVQQVCSYLDCIRVADLDRALTSHYVIVRKVMTVGIYSLVIRLPTCRTTRDHTLLDD